MLKTRNLTLGAVCCALSLLFLLLCNIAPSGKLSLGFIASLVPCILYVESKSIKTTLIAGISLSFAAMILIPKTGGLSTIVTIAYSICLSYYPAFKALIERMNNLIAEWILKEVFFIIISGVLCFILNKISLPVYNLPTFVIALTLYDLLLSFVLSYYINKISPRIQKSK